MKKCFIFFGLLTFLAISLSFESPSKSLSINQTLTLFSQDTLVWTAPESANALVNTAEVDEESLEEGRMIYNKNCRSCHGKLGDGTGSGGKELETKPTDFTNPNFLNQSDGSMFWKISEGRKDMKSFKAKLDEEETWLVVNYIKTFASTDK